MKNIEMVTTLNNLYNIVNAKKEYSRKVSYAITKNIFSLRSLYEPYEEERKKIIEKYRDSEEEETDTDTQVIPNDKKKDFEKELKELLDIEISFKPHMVTLDEFPENVEPALLYDLDFMIEE